jgi:hypothetical protein
MGGIGTKREVGEAYLITLHKILRNYIILWKFEKNILMNITEIWSEIVDWIRQAQGKVKWRVFMDKLMALFVLSEMVFTNKVSTFQSRPWTRLLNSTDMMCCKWN